MNENDYPSDDMHFIEEKDLEENDNEQPGQR